MLVSLTRIPYSDIVPNLGFLSRRRLCSLRSASTPFQQRYHRIPSISTWSCLVVVSALGSRNRSRCSQFLPFITSVDLSGAQSLVWAPRLTHVLSTQLRTYDNSSARTPSPSFQPFFRRQRFSLPSSRHIFVRPSRPFDFDFDHLPSFTSSANSSRRRSCSRSFANFFHFLSSWQLPRLDQTIRTYRIPYDHPTPRPRSSDPDSQRPRPPFFDHSKTQNCSSWKSPRKTWTTLRLSSCRYSSSFSSSCRSHNGRRGWRRVTGGYRRCDREETVTKHDECEKESSEETKEDARVGRREQGVDGWEQSLEGSTRCDLGYSVDFSLSPLPSLPFPLSILLNFYAVPFAFLLLSLFTYVVRH